ncbi:hypothetical protein C8R47DRAFT_1063943, partial [Mycena vitilis]
MEVGQLRVSDSKEIRHWVRRLERARCQWEFLRRRRRDSFNVPEYPGQRLTAARKKKKTTRKDAAPHEAVKIHSGSGPRTIRPWRIVGQVGHTRWPQSMLALAPADRGRGHAQSRVMRRNTRHHNPNRKEALLDCPQILISLSSPPQCPRAQWTALQNRTPASATTSLDEVRAQVRALEDDHRAAGIPLSGVLHVSPRRRRPPLEPIHSDAESDDAPHDDVKAWTLVPRGHAAMISGIRSLAATHEQLIVGWTGDVQSASECKVPSCDVPAAARVELEDALRTYQPKESDPDDDRKTVLIGTRIVPLFHYLLWQDIAAEETSQDAHYDAYAKANAAFAQRIAELNPATSSGCTTTTSSSSPSSSASSSPTPSL